MAFAEKENCIGCSACYNICLENCIQMIPDNEGFLYPEITDKGKCTDCGMCSAHCQVMQKSTTQPTDGYPKAFAAINKNESVRGKSTSGGIFHLLAEQIIFKNGIVFGAKFDAEYSVVYGSEITLSGVAEFCGSKYVQTCYRRDLQ